jgi:integral membrane protein
LRHIGFFKKLSDIKMDKYKNYLTVGKIEGYSYLMLLLIAMPLKYLFNIPLAVKIAGMIHGILFVAFMYILLQLMLDKALSFKQAVYSFILSIVPFGTFYLKKVIEKN